MYKYSFEKILSGYSKKEKNKLHNINSCTSEKGGMSIILIEYPSLSSRVLRHKHNVTMAFVTNNNGREYADETK